MSLQVWLPLTGNLHNQGLSDATIINGDITANDNGKIGKCVKTGNSAIDLRYDGATTNTESLSIGGWFKFNQSEIATRLQSATINEIGHSPVGNLIGNNSYGGIGLIWETNNMYQDGTLNELHVFGNMRSSTLGYRSTGTYSINFDQWTHIFLIFDKSLNTETLYVNGVVISQVTSLASFSDMPTRNVQINAALVCGGNGPGVNIPFYCNDVRLYNHALTEKEVKDISRGLVLHYPLSNNGFGNENLILNSDVEKNTRAGIVQWDLSDSAKADIKGKSYTISADIKSTEDNSVIDCYVRSPSTSQSMSTSTIFRNITTEYKRYSLQSICNVAQSGTPETFCFRANGSNGTTSSALFTIKNLKLEYSDEATAWCPNPNDSIKAGYNDDIIRDISGFGNDGIVTGVLNILSDTPRYKVSTYFDGSSYALTDASSFSWFNFDQCTLSIWMNPTTTPSSWAGTFGIAHDNSSGNKSFVIGNYGGKFTVQSANGGWVNIQSSDLPINEWHHCVATLDGATIKMYFDGELVKTYTTNWGTTTVASDTRIQVGIDLPGSNEIYQGYYSDARIYVTALSAADIVELYEMGVSA